MAQGPSSANNTAGETNNPPPPPPDPSKGGNSNVYSSSHNIGPREGHRDAGFGVLGAGKKRDQKEVPSPRVELGTKR